MKKIFVFVEQIMTIERTKIYAAKQNQDYMREKISPWNNPQL
jgi:hypothetical protein